MRGQKLRTCIGRNRSRRRGADRLLPGTRKESESEHGRVRAFGPRHQTSLREGLRAVRRRRLSSRLKVTTHATSGTVLWSYRAAQGLVYIAVDSKTAWPVEVLASQVVSKVTPWEG